MHLLISIRPKYAEQIFSGDKKFEYRKTRFKRDFERAVVYASSPIKSLIGEFAVDDIIEDTPENLWEQTKAFGCISRTEFFRYFANCNLAVAIKIGQVTRYPKPIDPRERYGQDFTPPQSFFYKED